MSINTSNDIKLEQVPYHKLLGVTIDEDLSFDSHTDSDCKKLAKRIGLLRSIRYFLPKPERIHFYNAVIKPALMYGSTIWGSTSTENLRRVFRLQKRAARAILNVKIREERTVSLFNKLTWIPFYDETKINKCSIIYKCLQGDTATYLSEKIIQVSDLSSRTTRYSNITLRCPRYIREKEGGKTFINTSTKLWNSLPTSIRQSKTLNIFKNSFFSFLKEQYIDLDHFPIS